MSDWENRIVGYGEEDPQQLLANPLNAHRHPGNQRDVIRASLDELGWIAPIIVNQRTGFLVDGHLRAEESITKGIKSIPVVYVDLTEQEEANALATYDPIGYLGTHDTETLMMLREEADIQVETLNDLLDSLKTEDIPLMSEPPSKERREHVCPNCGTTF